MSIYSYSFSMCLLRTAIFFPILQHSMLYYNSLKGFRRCFVDTRQRNVTFIRNKFGKVTPQYKFHKRRIYFFKKKSDLADF